MPVKLGVIGLGFGENHVRTIANLDGAKLVAVADTESERLSRISEGYGVTGYADGIKMMKSEHLDGVSLCVSPRFREPLIRYAADNGVAMFIEKPLATDPAQARLFTDICRDGNAKVLMGFSFRFHPVVRKLQELVANDLGRGWMANAQYVFDWLPPESAWIWDPENGNGFFNENSCHVFDVVCSLMGKPEEVFAYGGVFVGRPSEEAAVITIRFEDGGMSSVTVGGIGASPFKDYPHIDLWTEHGRASLYGYHHTWHKLEWGIRGADETRTYVESPETLGATRYSDAFAHFIDMIVNGASPLATLEDGQVSVGLARAIYESIRSSKPVRLVKEGA